MIALRLATFVAVVVCGLSLAPLSAADREVDSPFYGEVLYNFYQHNYFSAAVITEKETTLARLGNNTFQARTLLGSLYLSYGLHRRAQAIFEQVLDDSADDNARDLAWFYLAKIQYQRGLYQSARRHLKKISSPLAPRYEDERLSLAALIALRLDDYPAAIAVLDKRGDSETDAGVNYARFNLALAKLGNGEQAAGEAMLEEMARQPKQDKESTYLIDRINVALGFQQLEQQQFQQAQTHFKRVQLRGPLSNRALLGLGWAAFGVGDYGAATAAWQELAERDTGDTAVLEAYLALPYIAYQHQRYSDALDQYNRAIEIYDAEIAALDAQLNRENFANVIEALLTEEHNEQIGWRWQGEVLAGPLLNRYMLELVAGHRFQEGLKNYRDLLFVARNLDTWRRKADVYADIIDFKEAAYAELKPRARQRLNALANKDYSAPIRKLRTRIAYVELDEDAMALTTTTEQTQLQQLRSIDYRLSSNLAGLEDRLDHVKLVKRADKLSDKRVLLEGVLKWQVMTGYKARLWDLKKKLAALEAEQEETIQRRRDIKRIIGEIPESFAGHQQRLATLERRLESAAEQVARLRGQHEAYLYGLIREKLAEVKQIIELYRSQAQLSVAHIYDLNLNLQEGGQ